MDDLAILTLKAAQFVGKFHPDGSLTNEGHEIVEKNASLINKILNDHRSSCQHGMKEVCIAWMKQNHRKTLPSNAEFMKIIERDEDVNKELFKWWWDIYMPKAAGSQKIWNDKVKYYGLLSTHAPPDTPKKPYITPSTEAWGMLLIENCRNCWPKIMALKATSGNRITYTKGSKANTKANTTYVNVETDPTFLGTYTKTDAGQKKFGGWSNEGLKRYKELYFLNKEARKKATTPALEQEILDALRAENGIEAETWEDQRKKTTGKTTGVVPAEEVADLFGTDELDDED